MIEGADLAHDAGTGDLDGSGIFTQGVGDNKGAEIVSGQIGPIPIDGNGLVVDDNLLLALKDAGFGGGTATTTDGLDIFFRFWQNYRGGLRFGNRFNFGGIFLGEFLGHILFGFLF